MESEEAKQKKLVATILAILLDWLGLHKFYLGYINAGQKTEALFGNIGKR